MHTGVMITKRCKQQVACKSNERQNDNSCDSRRPDSVCRCCCEGNLCNKNYFCHDNNCAMLRQPKNGKMKCDFEKSQTELGSVCEFSCSPGYALIGETTSTCSKGNNRQMSKFDNPAPVCVPRLCKTFQRNPVGGRVRCSTSNRQGSVCTFSCNDGYELEGDFSTVCGDDMEWTNAAPTCRPNKCYPEQENPENGRALCSRSNFEDSVCRFGCVEDYMLVGPISTTCGPNGTWTSPPPVCKAVCVEHSILYGSVDCTDGNMLNSVCTYSCSNSYRLEGNANTQCVMKEDGTHDWSEAFPLCVARTCSDVQIDDGFKLCSDGNFLFSSCRVRCDPLYEAEEEVTVTCRPRGRNFEDWDKPFPSCIKQTCLNATTDSPANGFVVCSDGNNVRSTCYYGCEEGYELSGNQQVSCGDDLLWDGEPPVCNRRKCGDSEPIPPVNGFSICSDENNYKSNCYFGCDPDYTMVGNGKSTCDENELGEDLWDAEPPICIKRECVDSSFLEPEFGTVSCTDGNFLDSVCLFQCDSGFELTGSLSVSCARTGDDSQSWNSQPPTCQRVQCEAHGELKNGEIVCTNENFFESECVFSCNEPEWSLLPPETTSSICQADRSHNTTKPCCYQPCPPYGKFDLVIVLDSNAPIDSVNYAKMQDFVQKMNNSFVLSSDFVQISVFKYSDKVDELEHTTISLEDVTTDVSKLITEFKLIPFLGDSVEEVNGTSYVKNMTQRAIQYSLNVMLAQTGSDDRESFKDIFLLFTDGKSKDFIAAAADRATSSGFLLYAVGLDVTTEEGLETLVKKTETNDIFLYDEEDPNFANNIAELFCDEPKCPDDI